MEGTVEISAWTSGRDSVSDATDLLHRAYGAHIAGGISFGAAAQDRETTESRIKTAQATWAARADNKLVGIISYYGNRRYPTEPEWYTRSDVGHFGQFAVDPTVQSQGIGSQLLQKAEERAARDGKTEFSCDTACGATRLIAFYMWERSRETEPLRS